MTDKLRWGLLGTGYIAGLFVTDLNANGFAVQAVGSRNAESAAAFASEHGVPVAHGSYEELVADPDVDIVYVASPHPFHAEHATLALNAGKHVLVEKSFTVNAAEARQIVELAEERGLVILEAMWTRWLPHMLRIREIIAAGTIGDVRTVIADHNQNLPKDPAHRLQDPALGGGALLDLGIYPVSFAWDMLGKPSTVNAISSPTPTGVDRQTAMVFGYPDGQQALLHCALDTAGPNQASVIGTEGWIEIDTVFYQPSSFTVRNSAREVIERYEASEHPVVSRGMQYQAWEIERLVAASTAGDARTSDILSPEESVQIMETLDEVRSQIGLRYPGEA